MPSLKTVAQNSKRTKISRASKGSGDASAPRTAAEACVARASVTPDQVSNEPITLYRVYTGWRVRSGEARLYQATVLRVTPKFYFIAPVPHDERSAWGYTDRIEKHRAHLSAAEAWTEFLERARERKENAEGALNEVVGHIAIAEAAIARAMLGDS